MRRRDAIRAEPQVPGPPPAPPSPPASAHRSPPADGRRWRLMPLPARPLWWENRRGMVFDALVALGCALFPTVLVDVQGQYPLGLPAPAYFTLAVLTGLAVVVRRRWPTWLCVAVILALPAEVCFPALTICLYSLAKYGRSRRTLAAVSTVATAATGAYLLLTYQRELTVEDLVSGIPLLGLLLVVPVLAGLYGRARRTVVENLRERAERLEREQRLLASQTRMEERARIAREMHDVVAHRVSLMVIHSGALEVTPADRDHTTQARLIGEIGRQALDELRQVLGVLRVDESEKAAPRAPQPTLNDLSRLVDQSRAAGMRIELTTSGPSRPLDATAERTAYRLVQETLTNAHKHAGGAATLVRLRYMPDELHITVDNEVPGAPSTARLPSGGHGLVGLRERVTVLGGTFEAGPGPDGGFRVSAVIPTREEAP
ncbi:histidine kinase [Streptomyces decoyicus]|uniref:histidine kinase n=1 Tax=Streptomyces decoyicus TaxID=249567 RepID=A0ABZ1FPT0_9ACTN|nr:histidine kinase [Streptomyces decoyicus]WSB72464.1 histidine kinase [Streptomyces decoyicus]